MVMTQSPSQRDTSLLNEEREVVRRPSGGQRYVLGWLPNVVTIVNTSGLMGDRALKSWFQVVGVLQWAVPRYDELPWNGNRSGGTHVLHGLHHMLSNSL